jgi:hypothetical protein
MSFQYRKNVNGDGVIAAKDYPLDATYKATAKVGDIVRINGSGNVVLAATGDTTVAGVIAGFSFDGVGVSPLTAKVQISPDAIYEATTVGAGAITLGTAYGIDGSSNLDTADTTVTIAKIVEVVGGKPYVQITARQLN